MSRLLRLPNELLDDLLTITLPADLENFASTCKQIHTLAASHLIKHRTLIQKQSVLNDDQPYTIADTLKNVLTVPYIGHYIRRLQLHHVRSHHRNFKPEHTAGYFELFS